MRIRRVVIPSGQVFRVPQNIVRLDSGSTHGWQLRYGDSTGTMFSDFSQDGKGARAALRLAIEELGRRIGKLPAPISVRTEISASKQNDLPVGISGPTERRRSGKNIAEYYLQVSIPVAGSKSIGKSIYIGTENTYSEERFEAALAKAVVLRNSGVRKYKVAATREKRETARRFGMAT